MAAYRLEHVGIVATPATVEATQRFYEGVFGWRKIKEIPGYIFIGDGSGGRLELLITDAPTLSAPNHLAFVVPKADFDQVVEKIRAAGVAMDDPFTGPTGDPLCYFSDPSGNRAQIVARSEPMPE